jgi:hypothetical protein
MAFIPLKLMVWDTQDGLEVRVVGEYSGKKPTKPESRKAARQMLQIALQGIDKADYGGFAEDDLKRLRRESWLVTEKGKDNG